MSQTKLQSDPHKKKNIYIIMRLCSSALHKSIIGYVHKNKYEK